MSTRRKSLAVGSNPSLPTRVSNRRASTAAFAAPVLANKKPAAAKKPAPAKPVRKNVKTEPKKKEDSFVAGDLFDFSGMESPKGPMTRSRRSSMYVAPLKTSTQRKTVTKKSRLDSVIETPKDINDDSGEISFKPESAKKRGRKSLKTNDENSLILTEAKVIISPIKKAALNQAFARSAIKIASPKKKELPAKKKELLPKLNILQPSKSTQNMPGTPQPTDPQHLLKRNLKRKVDVRMDKKIAEIPQNSSPYTLINGETENGSPVEHFVKLNNKPSKENVTGTPAPKKTRVLRSLDTNQKQQTQTRRRSATTPRKLNMTNLESPKVEEIKTPKVETENAAVNKTLAKMEAKNVEKTAQNGTQMITGDLASLCVVM